MTTFTELVATVVVNSSALALSHFGVAMTPSQIERVTPPPAERVIARTHTTPAQSKLLKTACPDPARKARPLRA
ncbi:hypothetical protein [Phenylobacterium sp.]|jgi:hypothetical protein|uniref:hypothetical protein n=1 Tax=Phenylobacterium sp. TaxID=1871053 RepID=UPI002F42470C